ncbi:CoA transferase [Mesorhizobium sp. NZP2077]|uniref:CoA transferase n=1 Tax=Mesorhizobium sp. NZP2077 TaxID=2483404 RepID=UPI001FEE8992|nr:CoA transferase [Mesorhizobium sp. NZP2077]
MFNLYLRRIEPFRAATAGTRAEPPPLALLGADAIKVEGLRGADLARQLGGSPKLNQAGMAASFLAQNAGKRSVVLDLKAEADRERFLDLIAGADALVENFRPGAVPTDQASWRRTPLCRA